MSEKTYMARVDDVEMTSARFSVPSHGSYIVGFTDAKVAATRIAAKADAEIAALKAEKAALESVESACESLVARCNQLGDMSAELDAASDALAALAVARITLNQKEGQQ